MDARRLGNGHLVLNADVLIQLVIPHLPDTNRVAVLLDRRVWLNPPDALYRIAVEPAVDPDTRDDVNAVGRTSVDMDAA